MAKLAELAGVTSLEPKKTAAAPAKKAEPEPTKEDKPAPKESKPRTKIVFEDDDDDIVFGKPKEKPKVVPVKKPVDPLTDFLLSAH